MSAFPHSLTLRLLGCHILVRCRHRACAEGVAEYYASTVCEPWCTPDVVVDCAWSEASRYLFRARPPEAGGILKGIRVRAFGETAKGDWPHSAPPLPPLCIHPLRHRFVGLHAAAVVLPGGAAVLLAGDRGSGKTTLAVELCNVHGCGLLTDETVCIHRRTRLVEPFPRLMGVWVDDGRSLQKRTVPAPQLVTNIATEAALTTHLFLLRPDQATPTPRIDTLSAQEAFPYLLEHHVDVGCTFDEALVCLAHLCHELTVATLSYQSYKDLRDGAALVLGNGGIGF